MADPRLKFSSVPAGSISDLAPEERSKYIDKISDAGPNLRKMLLAPYTGAYIIGVIREKNLPETSAPTLAFIVLQVATGTRSLAELGNLISAKLQVANDVAQAMAQEIEKELLEPVMDDILAQAQKQRQAGSGSLVTGNQPGGPQNLLNLKDQKRPPSPPPITRVSRK